METARLEPQGGTRTPGALEDGGSDASGAPRTSNDGCKGAGACIHEGPCSPGAGTAENTRITDRSINEGPCSPGAGTAEDTRITDRSSNEGPCGPGAGIAEDTRSNEGPGGPRAGIAEDTRSNEGPCGSRAGTTEGPCGPRSGNAEGPQSPAGSITSGPRSPVVSSSMGPQIPASSSDEGPCSAGADGPRGPASGSIWGPGIANSEGPQRPNSSSAKGPGNGETPSCTRGSQEHEVPRTSKSPPASGGITTKQRITEDPHGSGTEGPDALGTNSPTKSPLAKPDSAQQHAGPSQGSGPGEDAGNAEPFKKPGTPTRPDGHEKTLEPRNKPQPGGEAAPTGGPRLPSDACGAGPTIPYGEPAWSGRPHALYSLEVLKGGAILSTKSLNDDNWSVFGRLPVCHVSLEHPSVSRFHAVLQYRSIPGSEPDQETGFYMYDLGSTHGTFINKQKIPPKTYCRYRVGHVLKLGGSTRLFVLQGPDEDQEAESEQTVTQIKETRRQRENLQKRMMGDDSDEEDDLPEEEDKRDPARPAAESGCTWGMGEDAMEEENDEENPIALQFQEEREALYLKDPKKTLQGFFDREGEELEFEYDERGPGSWICRIKLPVDDSAGKQLVAEINHSGKKKDAARLCSLEACRMLDMRGLLRQEAVSRKRKSKKWEDEDFYDSDDDTFLDRTGIVEKKRLTRMKKAGKIEEKPETLESLTKKLELVEKEMEEIAAKLKTSHTGAAQPSMQDSLDAFMTEIRAGSSMDSVSRKKLNLKSLELKKEQQRLKTLIRIVQPTKLPELKTNPATQDPKAKKLALPMFGAMKGGSKFRLKTGTVGKLPPKRTELPASLFTMKDDNEVEEEEEDENLTKDIANASSLEAAEQSTKTDFKPNIQGLKGANTDKEVPSPEKQQGISEPTMKVRSPDSQKPSASLTDTGTSKAATEKQKKMYGPSKPPQDVSTKYPEDDPDYCVWTPPAGQTGDGKTHLNDKYGY